MGVWARLTWSELTPLLALANARQRLEVEDLPPIQRRATCEAVLESFAGVWQRSARWLGGGRPGVRFVRAVASHFKGLLLSVLVLRVTNDMISFAGPLALEQIIGWLQDPAQRRVWWEPAGLPPQLRGLWYVAVMSVANLASTLIGVQEQALALTMGSQVSTVSAAGCSLCVFFPSSKKRPHSGRGPRSTPRRCGRRRTCAPRSPRARSST